MKNVIIALLLLTTVYACNKDKQKQYSTWYVNGQKLSTNDVNTERGKAIYVLSTSNYEFDSNGFQMAVRGDGISPTVHWLDCASDICFKLRYNGNEYVGQLPGTISASNNNNKYSLKLNGTWFHNSIIHDSILVKGVFNEP